MSLGKVIYQKCGDSIKAKYSQKWDNEIRTEDKSWQMDFAEDLILQNSKERLFEEKHPDISI